MYVQTKISCYFLVVFFLRKTAIFIVVLARQRRDSSAWWMKTSITCVLFMAANTLHAIPITIALCRLIPYLIVYAIQEAPYWLVSNTFGRMFNALPHQGSKRQHDLRSDGKLKRKQKSGGEKATLYFRWKRNFYKMQYHRCNGKPKWRRHKRRHVVIEGRCLLAHKKSKPNNIKSNNWWLYLIKAW